MEAMLLILVFSVFDTTTRDYQLTMTSWEGMSVVECVEQAAALNVREASAYKQGDPVAVCQIIPHAVMHQEGNITPKVVEPKGQFVVPDAYLSNPTRDYLFSPNALN
jgi:hypothetical protein